MYRRMGLEERGKMGCARGGGWAMGFVRAGLDFAAKGGCGFEDGRSFFKKLVGFETVGDFAAVFAAEAEEVLAEELLDVLVGEGLECGEDVVEVG